ncbi:hypothetical protein [Corynebacterium phocae]|nr:hypothetical protein [Corynebacterium phocae]
MNKENTTKPTAIGYSKIVHEMVGFKDVRGLDFDWEDEPAVFTIE